MLSIIFYLLVNMYFLAKEFAFVFFCFINSINSQVLQAIWRSGSVGSSTIVGRFLSVTFSLLLTGVCLHLFILYSTLGWWPLGAFPYVSCCCTSQANRVVPML